MLVCPHCNQEIEVSAAKDVSWWRHQSTNRGVSLGCGTLIIIAIIVAVFSDDSGISNLSRQVDELTVIVEEIRTSLTETP